MRLETDLKGSHRHAKFTEFHPVADLGFLRGGGATIKVELHPII